MPTATFYTHVSDPVRFCCRLAARVLRSEKSLWIWAQSDAQAEEIDRSLWQSDPASFIPHETVTPQHLPDRDTPVLVAAAPPDERFAPQSVVINLSGSVWPPSAAAPGRILEIAGASLEELEEARGRLKTYRSQGFAIEHHNMQGKA